MQCVLNFSGEENTALKRFLGAFEQLRPGPRGEARCRLGNSTLTLYSSGKLLIQGPDCEKAKKRVLESVDLGKEIVLGIDETGRGEGTGPFVIAAVLAAPRDMRELRDSKKTGDIEAKRSIVEEKALAIATFSVSSKELSELHEKGINMNKIEAMAINAIHGFFSEISGAKTIVDGSPLRGTASGVSFLVKGDDLNPVVGAASVVAKSARDSSADKGKRKDWGSWREKKG
jgi:ribonuclease HII